MGLREYRAKRDFGRTTEPAPNVLKARQHKELMFVVQKHAATRLHYDFRLEMEGVLKSWAVPKGFPTTRGERRLAVQVEDHPFDYRNFEGRIPEGNYGAGTVMVWDTGTYALLAREPLKARQAGKIHMMLVGKKLEGEWTLVRTRFGREEANQQWLLIKTGEDAPALSKRATETSVLTHRTLEQISKAKRGKEWKS